MLKLNANFATRSRTTRSLDPRKHDLNSIRFGNFSNVRRILTLHFIPGGGGAVEEKRTDEMGAKSVLSSSRQFTNSPPSHNPVQTKPIYIARAVLLLPTSTSRYRRSLFLSPLPSFSCRRCWPYTFFYLPDPILTLITPK